MNICLVIDIDDTLYVHKSGASRLGFMDYNNILPNIGLSNEIKRIKLPKYILTNATFGHANEILNKMDLDEEFNKIYARNNMPISKPHKECYERVQRDIIRDLNKQVDEYLFFDDLLENLEMGKNRNWITIWIHPLYQYKDKYNYIDYSFPDIYSALNYFNNNNI